MTFADPSIAVTPPANTSTPSTYSLNPETIPGTACRYCMGLQKVTVKCPGGIAGYFVSEFPWWCDFTDDPETHPSGPHYQVEWQVFDPDDNLVFDLMPVTSLALTAQLLKDRFRRG